MKHGLLRYIDRRLVAMAGLAFTILASYETARPAAESLFLSRHDYTALPMVWAWVAGACVVTVALYNRLASRLPLHHVMLVCAGFTAVALAAARWAYAADVPYSAYALYVWKDVYIVVMVEVFWTYANASYPLKTARWIYGLFLVMGSFGSICGSRLVRVVAEAYGTANALWVVVPLMGVVAALALVLGPPVDGPTPAKGAGAERTESGFMDGLRVLAKSRYLGLLLGLILAVQVVVTLVDYRFNHIVSAAYADEGARTAIIAQVYEVIGWGALAMQVLTGPLLRWIGVSGAMVAVPVVAIGATLSLAIAPVFLAAAAAKVSGKVLDYSLFRAAKELLYLPLSYAEKTQGKAFVDMLTYRVAKGGVALLLKGLVAVGFASALGGATVTVACVWLALAIAIVRRYRPAADP